MAVDKALIQAQEEHQEVMAKVLTAKRAMTQQVEALESRLQRQHADAQARSAQQQTVISGLEAAKGQLEASLRRSRQDIVARDHTDGAARAQTEARIAELEAQVQRSKEREQATARARASGASAADVAEAARSAAVSRSEGLEGELSLLKEALDAMRTRAERAEGEKSVVTKKLQENKKKTIEGVTSLKAKAYQQTGAGLIIRCILFYQSLEESLDVDRS